MAGARPLFLPDLRVHVRGCVLPCVDACQEEAGLGPGGLDPVEVFNTLPEALQDAFESQVRPREQSDTAKK